MSPTARSLAVLRKQGALAQVVETFNHYAKVRVDLFGWIDIVSIDPDHMGVLGVQATTATNAAHRMAKLTGRCRAPLRLWLDVGNRLELHTWRLGGPRDTRKTWILTVRPISPDDLP